MGTVYLIDYENTSHHGLVAIKPKKGDLVLLFCNGKDRVQLSLLEKIGKQGVRVYPMPVNVGRKNALDFQLSSALGFILAQNLYKKHVIVTKDLGFTALIPFWSERGKQIEVISPDTGYQTNMKTPDQKDALRQALGKDKRWDDVWKCFEKANSLSDLHERMQCTFRDASYVKKTYQLVKPLFAEKERKLKKCSKN